MQIAASATTIVVVRASPEASEGRRQGRYVLGELLGRGGMAEVFAGNALGSHGFQKPVAIKRLLPELANDEVFVERLISEAKLLVGMTHGNIVSVLDLARDGDDVFLVMEFVDGPSLRQLMKARGDRGVPLGTATYVVQAAAAGLEFAHGRPGGAVIHADISPSNILLTTSGEVRVADFGIARREGGAAGVVEGKWAYMAPEQARGEPLTPRSDVFALGVVLYELITGEHPLGRQVTAGERELEPKRIVPPRALRPAIPPGLDAVCMKALAYEPRDRYARMQNLIDALVDERFASGWRESANDLAQLIREIQLGAAPAKENTQHTNRPVTIVTRSLISQQLAQRQSAPGSAASGSRSGGGATAPSASASGSVPHTESPRAKSKSKSQSQPARPAAVVDEPVPKLFDSAARTTAVALDDSPGQLRSRPDSTPAPLLAPSGALTQLAAQAYPDAPPPNVVVGPQAYGLSPDMLRPAPRELSSAHGGAYPGEVTARGRAGTDGARNVKWAAGVLAFAAVCGAITAMIMSGDDGGGVPFAVPDLSGYAPPPAPPAPPTKPPAPAAPVGPATAQTPQLTPEEMKNLPVLTIPPRDPNAPVDTPVVGDKPAPAGSGAVVQRDAHGLPRPSGAGAHKPAGEGVLIFDSDSGAATVAISGQREETPDAKFRLAAGSYSVRVKGGGESFTCTVAVQANVTGHIHVSVDDHTCDRNGGGGGHRSHGDD